MERKSAVDQMGRRPAEWKQLFRLDGWFEVRSYWYYSTAGVMERYEQLYTNPSLRSL